MRFTLALPVKFRIEFQILLIVFKIFKDLPPSYLHFLITLKVAEHSFAGGQR